MLQLDGDVGVQLQKLPLLQLVLEIIETVGEEPPPGGLENLDPLLIDRLLLVFDHGVPRYIRLVPDDLQLPVVNPPGHVVVLSSPAPEQV